MSFLVRSVAFVEVETDADTADGDDAASHIDFGPHGEEAPATPNSETGIGLHEDLAACPELPPMHVRGRATCWLRLPEGVIRYYKRYETFEATCNHKDHREGTHKCRLTRSSRGCAPTDAEDAAMHDDQLAVGRLVALMALWLRLHANASAHHEHINYFWLVHWLPFPQREAMRDELMAFDDGRRMCACEREQRDGEGPEPIGFA